MEVVDINIGDKKHVWTFEDFYCGPYNEDPKPEVKSGVEQAIWLFDDEVQEVLKKRRPSGTPLEQICARLQKVPDREFDRYYINYTRITKKIVEEVERL